MSNFPHMPKVSLQDLKFSDLVFLPYEDRGKVSSVSFANGFGLSIVQAPECDGDPESYGASAGLYEAVIIICTGSDTAKIAKGGNVFGYLTEEGVLALIKDVVTYEPFDPKLDAHLLGGSPARKWYDLAGICEDFFKGAIQGMKDTLDREGR